MSISGVSMADSLASMATQAKAEDIRGQIAVAVLKQVQDQNAQQAEALLEMMRATPAPAVAGLGGNVDLYA